MESLTSQSYQTLAVEMSGHILHLTLQRPEKKNAMSFVMVDELISIAKQVGKQRDIRAVIIKGAEQTFCTGLDLGDLNNPKNQLYAAWELAKPWQSHFQKVCLIWRDVPVPVICVLQGHCLGAGLQLALGTDIRISTADCKFAVMEAKWGLVADMGLTQAALGVVNADVLKELAMSARMIEGQEAHQLGLVTHVSDEPLAYATQLAEELSSRSPDAVLASKRMINQMYAQSALTLYQEKFWQLKLMLGYNRKLALKKARDAATKFRKRQFN
ncbi:crotonase/enoyl-CoA hydratase family protein [Psychrobacter sp. I-STPA10]|uniref:crotonase/enoyl-CoA hydratase family protein n=1 Tax=Psychrobacter sp. I-STPA10 TaxID=2585769 RepID=UPI001E44CCF3|nr:crotonase/enoyl-CoA hydratase family protein [Psychrobacter sp. I-STPA10]